MKTDLKSEQQKRWYFLMQEWIASEMTAQDITMESLVSKIRPRATKNALHEVFKEILYKMYQKTSTNDMTREEMANCLDVYFEALAQCNIHIEFPDEAKKNLLQFYS